MATLGGIALGTVTSETVSKQGNLTPIPLLFLDADKTNVFDYGGVTRVITIEGYFNGTLAANLTSIQNIEALQAGNQIDTIVYDSDFRADMNVKIEKIDSTITGGTPRILVYTISMIQAEATV